MKRIFLGIFIVSALFYGCQANEDLLPKNEVAKELALLRLDHGCDVNTKGTFYKTISTLASFEGMCSQNPSFVQSLFQRVLLADIIKEHVQDKSFPNLYFLQLKKAPKVYEILKDLREKMGISSNIPVLVSRDKNFLNAFASSIFRGCGFICLGEELVNRLSDDELRGIIAHELAHIRNYHHIKINAFGFVALLSIITSLVTSSVTKQYPIGVAAFFVAPLMWLWYVRLCEKDADLTAAKFTGNPRALANAMRTMKKFATWKSDSKRATRNIEELFKDKALRLLLFKTMRIYVDIFSRVTKFIFATHPSFDTRIEYLDEAADELEEIESVA